MTPEERDRWWNEIRDPPLHWDRLGVPISLREWSELMEDPDYRRIGSTKIAGRWWISTVWLGINHAWFGGPPIIFETMVFDHGPRDQDSDRPDPYDDDEMERYSSEADARDGHERMVQLVMTLEGTEERVDAV